MHGDVNSYCAHSGTAEAWALRRQRAEYQKRVRVRQAQRVRYTVAREPQVGHVQCLNGASALREGASIVAAATNSHPRNVDVDVDVDLDVISPLIVAALVNGNETLIVIEPRPPRAVPLIGRRR